MGAVAVVDLVKSIFGSKGMVRFHPFNVLPCTTAARIDYLLVDAFERLRVNSPHPSSRGGDNDVTRVGMEPLGLQLQVVNLMGCEVVPDALMAIHGWWVGVHVGEVSVEPAASGLIGIVSDSSSWLHCMLRKP